MTSLKLFGGAFVEGEDGILTGAAVQRHRLALLALLAASYPRGIVRDRLLAYLWSESDTAHARNLLNQAVHVLRKALGDKTLRSVGDELRLDADMIHCDVIAFKASLAMGHLEHAVDLYVGPFLDGFFLSDALEFERWAQSEREFLHHAYCKALEGLAETATARGNLEGAVEWWRRLATEEPYNARVTLGLMEALEAACDRAGALQQASMHTTLLREEFDAEPHPEVVALAERMRAAPVVASPTGDGAAPRGLREHLTEPRQTRSGAGGKVPDLSAIPPLVRRTAGWKKRRWALGVGLAVAALLVGLWALWGVGQRESSTEMPVVSASTIAVLPFSVSGEEDLAYLEEGMVDLLSYKLDGAGTLRSVDPNALLGWMGENSDPIRDPKRGQTLATQFGAGRFILGSITKLGPQLYFSASLYTADGTLESRSAATAADEGALQQAIDALTRKLIAGLLNEPDQELMTLAAQTTPSLKALKAYLQGEQAVRAGSFEQGVETYARAVETDSTFALAWYRLYNALGWPSFTWTSFRISEETALQKTLQYRDRLPDHIQKIIHALEISREQGDAAEAERVLRGVLARHPAHPLALFQLGEVLYHYNPVYGRAAAEARAPFEQMLAYNPHNPEALIHLMEIALQKHQYDRYDTMAVRYIMISDSLNARWKEWERRLIHAEPEARAVLIDELREAPSFVKYTAMSLLALQLRDLTGALRLTQDPGFSPDRIRLVAGRLEVARGRFEAGLAALRAVRSDEEYGYVLYNRVLLHTLPFETRALFSRPTLEALREEVVAWDTLALPLSRMYDGEIKSYLEGRLSAYMGDSARVRSAISQLKARGEQRADAAMAVSLARSLEALVAWQEADYERALWLLDAAQIPPKSPGWPLYAQPMNRYLRGEALVAQGRRKEALRWYAALGDGYDWAGLEYVGPSYLRQAQVYEHLGEKEKAIALYTRFVILWEKCDPILRPWVKEAQQRLDILQEA